MQSKKPAKKIGPNLYCQIQCCIFIPSLHLGFSVAKVYSDYEMKLQAMTNIYISHNM